MRRIGFAWASLWLWLGACDRREFQPPPDAGAPSAPSPRSADPPRFVEPAPVPAAVAAVPADPGPCPERNPPALGILVSPYRPVVGRPVTVIAATLAAEDALSVELTAARKPLLGAVEVVPGVPSTAVARVAEAPAKAFEVVVRQAGKTIACESVAVSGKPPRTTASSSDTGVWPAQRAWTPAEEALYSAWVRALFHAPRDAELAHAALHELTSDPIRNLLHDHFGWGEDQSGRAGLYLRPDCADAPYFLRAYFAWKRRLPFGFRKCSRGAPGKAPRCAGLHHSLDRPEHGSDGGKSGELGIVQRYFRRTLAWGVHTGNGRTAFGDDDTDFYPLELSRRGLRPGTIYADPYGHVFVIAELMDPVGDAPGVLYAIDGQPDGSITRKRFWEGNFLWNPDPGLGGSGFKAFRPLVVDDGVDPPQVRALSDAEIGGSGGMGDASSRQQSLSAAQFYDQMDALITPGRRDAAWAQAEAVQALFEAARVRVTSVDNGEAYFAKGSGVIAMPDGHGIFETTGPWENFATPARDLRLLIAIDVVLGFDDKVRRNAAVMVKPGESLEAQLAALKRQQTALLADPKYAFEYRRSDGSPQVLHLRDLVARRASLEMGYNPNDCPEVRWGASAGSPEAATCRRRAPAEQQRKMDAYRVWFAERRRPARGDPGPRVQ